MKKNEIPKVDKIILPFDWDDLTVCALCGKSSPCLCYHFICPCGKKEIHCEWPEGEGCPDRTKE